MAALNKAPLAPINEWALGFVTFQRRLHVGSFDLFLRLLTSSPTGIFSEAPKEEDGRALPRCRYMRKQFWSRIWAEL